MKSSDYYISDNVTPCLPANISFFKKNYVLLVLLTVDQFFSLTRQKFSSHTMSTDSIHDSHRHKADTLHLTSRLTLVIL